MTLPNQYACVVDTLRQAKLENLCLKATLQEILDLEGQDVIETHARLVEHTDADETANEGVTLEETLGILVIELEQLTSRTTDLGKDETNAPDLALVAQTVLAGELHRVGQSAFAYDAVHPPNLCGTRTFSSASRRADSNGRRGTL